jgi:hypothetical protein
MKKGMFISNKQEFYFGTIALPGFKPFQRSDLKKNMAHVKNVYMCKKCSDYYSGSNPPKLCPTCNSKATFLETNKEEFLKFIEKNFNSRYSSGLMNETKSLNPPGFINFK